LGLIDVRRATLETCGAATGTVIVIDVLRAFTTAAFAFDAGAEVITVVAEVEDAFALRDEHPEWLIMGEVNGLPVEGFDFDNSPASFVGRDLAGRHLVQRTSSGTQGLVRSESADHLLASSLCCARATVACVSQLAPQSVTMVITGSHPGGLGDEDQACADYLKALLRGESLDEESVIERVRASQAGRKFTDPGHSQFSPIDLDYAVAVDRFSFAMVVRRQGDRSVMEAVYPGEFLERERSG
jgi:2-phosphosulfolactate phosphatase